MSSKLQRNVLHGVSRRPTCVDPVKERAHTKGAYWGIAQQRRRKFNLQLTIYQSLSERSRSRLTSTKHLSRSSYRLRRNDRDIDLEEPPRSLSLHHSLPIRRRAAILLRYSSSFRQQQTRNPPTTCPFHQFSLLQDRRVHGIGRLVRRSLGIQSLAHNLEGPSAPHNRPPACR